MNAIDLARSAYTSPTIPIRTARGTEYNVFARITHQLRSLDRAKQFPQFAQALHENRQLWTILAADVADDGNKLPVNLRAQIFYLAEFISMHTSKVLSGDSSAESLVEINASVMRGLRRQKDSK